MSSSSSSPPFSDAELEVAAILRSLPALIARPLRWASKRPRSLRPAHAASPAKDDDHPPSSSPVSPLFFHDPPKEAAHQSLKKQARSVARLREANRSLQLEAETARARYQALLAENRHLRGLGDPRALLLMPPLWMSGGIYGHGPSAASWEERKAASAEARRRRIEIKRRRIAGRKPAAA